jgi:small subunit ribosomal protein S2
MSEATANHTSVELMTELLEAGVHYGHQTKRWNPKMRDYILEEKNSIHIIDLGLTVEQIDSATKYLRDLVRNGGKVLFVGSKKTSPGSYRRGRRGHGPVLCEPALAAEALY